MTSEAESAAADRKVIETAAELRAVLLEEQKARAAEHKKEQQSRKKKDRSARVERLLTLFTVLLLLVVAFSNRGVLREVRASNQEIEDCTTPLVPSECSRRTGDASTRARRKVQDDIKTAAVAGAVCALHRTDEAAVRACVDRFFPPPPLTP